MVVIRALAGPCIGVFLLLLAYALNLWLEFIPVRGEYPPDTERCSYRCQDKGTR